MQKYPYNTSCTDRDLPQQAIVLYYKMRREKHVVSLCRFPKKCGMHGGVSIPCAFSVKENRSLKETAHGDRAQNSSTLSSAPQRSLPAVVVLVACVLAR